MQFLNLDEYRHVDLHRLSSLLGRALLFLLPDLSRGRCRHLGRHLGRHFWAEEGHGTARCGVIPNRYILSRNFSVLGVAG